MVTEPAKLDTMHSVPEVARRLGLKPSTIRRMILDKRIAIFRPSQRAVRISEKTIREILERGYVPAATGR